MKHIKHINEAYYNNPWDAPDPPDPKRDTDRPESARTLKCIAFTTYLTMLAKKSNPKELYLVQMEDPEIEDWTMDGGYSWEFPSGYDASWDERVDCDCIVDLVDDAIAGKLKPFEKRYKFSKHKTEVLPLSVGEGLESYSIPDIPGTGEEFKDLELDDRYAPIVKIDLPLAKFLEKELEYRGYQHLTSGHRSLLGRKPNKEYLKMLGAIIRAFPEIE